MFWLDPKQKQKQKQSQKQKQFRLFLFGHENRYLSLMSTKVFWTSARPDY